MYCWICGREMDRNDNIQYIPAKGCLMPVCDDDRTCGQRGNYGRLNAAEDEQLIRDLLELNEPLPRRLRRSGLFFRLRHEMNL